MKNLTDFRKTVHGSQCGSASEELQPLCTAS